MSFGIHPVVLIAIIGICLALLAVVIALLVRSNGWRILMIVLALAFMVPAGYVFLALNPELIDGRFRTYKAFYRDIQIGMTRDQVFSTLERRYPKNGPRQRPKLVGETPESIGFFMNPETSREPNCEGIFLTLEAGRVTKKQYTPD